MTKTLGHPRIVGAVDSVTQKAPYDVYTISLNHFDKVDASDGDDTYVVLDEISSRLWVMQSNWIQAAVKKFGTGSLEFSGVHYVSGDGHSDFAFGTGDFTIDFWFNPNNLGGGVNQFFIDFRDSSAVGYLAIYMGVDDRLYMQEGGVARISGTTVVAATGTWYHVALARAGTANKLFLNGVQQGATYTDTTNYLGAGSANRPFLGARSYLVPGTPATFFYTGRMDELRFSKGIARWTTAFTPPTVEYAPPVA